MSSYVKWLYRVKGMPHDILWPPTAQWDGYEEMRVVKTEAPPRLALYVRAWRHCFFFRRWIGRGGLRKRLLCDFFLLGWDREEICLSKTSTID